MADLITLTRAKYDIPAAQGNTTYDAQLAILISAASRAIQAWCGREFTSVTRDELYNGTEDRRLMLRDYPVLSVESVRFSPSEVLRVTNTSASNQQARVAVTSTGLKLVHVASGVSTTTTTGLTWAACATLSALATAVNAVGSGWSASAVSGYGSWPSADLWCPNGPTTPANAGQGMFNAKSVWAGLWLHAAELSHYEVHAPGGWLIRQGAWADPGPWGYAWPGTLNPYRVQYTSGYATVPESVQEACAKWVQMMFAQADNSVAYSYRNTAQYASYVIGNTGELPNYLKQLLAPFKKQRLNLLGG